MAPRRKTDHPVEVHSEYLAELRRRIEAGPGVGAVAAAAGMSRVTLWRVLNGGGDQRVTVDAVERARLGLESLDDTAEPMPPPIVNVRNTLHHAWIQLGEALLDAEPQLIDSAVASPAAARTALRSLTATPRSAKSSSAKPSRRRRP